MKFCRSIVVVGKHLFIGSMFSGACLEVHYKFYDVEAMQRTTRAEYQTAAVRLIRAYVAECTSSIQYPVSHPRIFYFSFLMLKTFLYMITYAGLYIICYFFVICICMY